MDEATAYERCARCGQVAQGMARIGDERYCHPDDPVVPSCYVWAVAAREAERWSETLQLLAESDEVDEPPMSASEFDARFAGHVWERAEKKREAGQ